MAISKLQAMGFYRDLCGTVYGDPEKNCGGIMSAEHIAELLRIPTETATEYLMACRKYGITERQGGAWVV